MHTLPIMRPRLPSAQALLPYLNRIDDSRIYSNFGPLSLELEIRLAGHFGVPEHGVTMVANGTLGLTLALLAQDAKAGSLCVIPAWTFIATAHAAVLAGLVPYFVDVDPSSWALDPAAIGGILDAAPGEVGAVMPVVPFGRPIDFLAWDEFRRRTGLPVVIDAAAGFDSVAPTGTPAVVSLHATKAMGVGEGGFVLSTDPSLIERVRVRSNFGFHGTRDSVAPAANAKLSEYHAAAGGAALDEWGRARAEWLDAAAGYRRALAGCSGTRLQKGFGDEWVSSVCVLDVGAGNALTVEQKLRDAGVETRRWWGFGAHAHPSSRGLPRTAVPVTELLARSTFGVPLYRDITPVEIQRVCLVAYDACKAAAAGSSER